MFVLFEAISNALQHSRATELRIEACETDDRIHVRVVDNGVGFDVASSWESGLLTLKNRAEQIGAHLDIQSAADGTRVEVVIPRR
jgi:signal transduction histidine kinase